MSQEVGGMVQSKRVKGAGSARTEGARRATGVGADAAAVGSGALARGQRWSASRKRDVVLRLLRAESLDTVSRDVGVEVYRLEAWKARALAGLELGLKEQAGAPLAAERAVSTSLRQPGSAFTVATPRHRRGATTTDRAAVAAGQRPHAGSRPGCRSSVLGHPGGSFRTAD